MARSLLEACKSAHTLGADFPSIWHQTLKGHPLVASLPTQGMDDDGRTLEVLLITGHRLVFGATGFSLAWG